MRQCSHLSLQPRSKNAIFINTSRIGQEPLHTTTYQVSKVPSLFLCFFSPLSDSNSRSKDTCWTPAQELIDLPSDVSLVRRHYSSSTTSPVWKYDHSCWYLALQAATCERITTQHALARSDLTARWLERKLTDFSDLIPLSLRQR